METYFNINYEFEPAQVHQAIAERLTRPGGDYITVADGVILDNTHRHPDYLTAVNGGMFAVCDSSYVPLYLRWIYGIERSQYCGSQIFHDVVASRRYRMIFLGTHRHILNGLRSELTKLNPDVASMTFTELPFCSVEEFDYAAIARQIEADGADIIWVALGAPKQEWFMHRLKPHLKRGVMIAVGAAFKFYSGLPDQRRAPQWMIRSHTEFVYRIFSEPRKQLRRCSSLLFTLPTLLYQENKRKKLNTPHPAE